MLSAPKQEVRVQIRWMIRRDMPEVLATEVESFEYPWLEEDFVRCLKQRNCIGMVAEHEDRVAGFMIYELHKSRIHVLNFAVAEAYRRRGVGSQMLAKLTAKLSSQRRSRVILEVRETNLAAQLFFRENGFRAVSVLHGYYADTPEDAYLMQYRYRPDRQPAIESDYQDVLIPALSGDVQIAITPVEASLWATLGLTVNSNRNSIWTCPNRPSDLPIYEPQYNQWTIGYQYFGGITTWKNPAFSGGIPSRSPIKTSTSKPYWTLAADTTMKIDGIWGGNDPGRPETYERMPSHTPNAVPVGGNQIQMDCSASWVKFSSMWFLHSWSTGGSRIAYFYQNPSDFDSALLSALPSLAAKP